MISILAFCGAVLAGGGLWTPGQPTVGEHEFVLPLGELEQDLLEKARMHRASSRKIVVFIPGLRAKKINRKYDEGPVRRMQTKRLKRGSTIALFTREPARKVFEHLDLKGRGINELSIQMMPVEKTSRLAESEEAPKAEPSLTNREETISTPSEVKTKPRLATGGSAMAASGIFGLIIAALSLILWFLKSNKKIDIMDDSIDVVAVKAFGGKHKLALIETCGEKLLLAASEKGVTLLSHVGNHLVPENGAEMNSGFGAFSIPDLNPVPRVSESEVEDQAAENVRKPSRPLAADLPTIQHDDSLQLATAKINSGSLSKDLEGLVKLREKRTNKSKQAVSGLAGHLTNRYRDAGAAA